MSSCLFAQGPSNDGGVPPAPASEMSGNEVVASMFEDAVVAFKVVAAFDSLRGLGFSDMRCARAVRRFGADLQARLASWWTFWGEVCASWVHGCSRHLADKAV
jgi:hypothetical protein